MNNKPLCPQCRYPMMKLAKYDGDCSLDAPGFERDEPLTNWPWPLRETVLVFNVVASLVRDVGKEIRNAIRRRKVTKLRDEVLPAWPQTLVCPHCLHLRKER